MRYVLVLGIFFVGFFSGCGRNTVTKVQAEAVNPFALGAPVGVGTSPALALDCPNGGSTLVVFLDANQDGALQSTETRLSESNICNGINGSSAGILIEESDLAACPAGGSVLKTFTDSNQNSTHEIGESINSITTLCNGVAGSQGLSANLSVTNAGPAQCSSGGAVYTSSVTGQVVPDVTVICNGANGSDGNDGNDGSNAEFSMGAVGASIVGKSYTACHHDYLYIPDSNNGDRGWLTFRHQANGSADQGIGATGFQIWNVDIVDFALASEVGGVKYCTLHWDPIAKVLDYTVVDNTDGLAGTQGTLNF